MPTNVSSKKQLLSDIRAHCLECGGGCSGVANCPSTRCSLWQHRFGYVSTQSTQANLFLVNDKIDFMQRTMAVILGMNGTPFSFSDVRNRSDFAPLHANWWGGVSSEMKKYGYKVISRRKSSTKTRNGAWENVWQLTKRKA